LAERVLAEASDGDPQKSKELYRQLDDVTGRAIDLMQRQRDILQKEIGQLDG
jgi:hypothetical protein